MPWSATPAGRHTKHRKKPGDDNATNHRHTAWTPVENPRRESPRVSRPPGHNLPRPQTVINTRTPPEAGRMNIIKTMYNWPGTPGPARLTAAELLIDQDARKEDQNQPAPWEQPGVLNQAHQDARMLLDYMDIYDFSHRAHQEMQRMVDKQKIKSGLDLAEIALRGSDERFIGMVIDRENPDDPDSQEGCSITCLYRHPEWVGLNPQLPQCHGLDIHIFYHQDNPDEPKVIIATLPNAMGDTIHTNGKNPQQERHDELSQAIKETTTWHGALRHTWNTSHPG